MIDGHTIRIEGAIERGWIDMAEARLLAMPPAEPTPQYRETRDGPHTIIGILFTA